MAGHSQFKNIMHRKGKQDSVRSKMFSKLAREITVAAKTGMPDPNMNPRLRLAIQNAKAQSMPKDNIERAIKAGTGKKDGNDFEELNYEGYAPCGVAVLVSALTDNRNRTAPEVKYTFEHHGGNMGATGSVSFMFDFKSIFVLETAGKSEDEMMEIAIEAGADDFKDEGDNWEIISTPELFEEIRAAVTATGVQPMSAQIAMLPKNLVKLEGKQAQRMIKLMDVLEDQDDVQNLWSNFDVDAKEIEASLA